MMAYEKISGFSDEIEKSVDVQFEVLNKLNIKYFEVRGVDGKNISTLTDEEVLTLKSKMEQYGIKVSSIGSPIGKIKIEEVTVKTANLQKKYKSLYEKTKTGFCYDFETNSYKMSLLLFCDKMYLQSNAEKNDIDFDLKINLYSKANVESSVHITIMLKDFANLKNCNLYIFLITKK